MGRTLGAWQQIACADVMRVADVIALVDAERALHVDIVRHAWPAEVGTAPPLEADVRVSSLVEPVVQAWLEHGICPASVYLIVRVRNKAATGGGRIMRA